MTTRVALAAALSILCALTCIGVTAAQEAPAQSALVSARLADASLDPTSRARIELLGLINASRAESGLTPLLLDARLTASASEHATDMAVGRFCRHGGSDGSSARTRMARHGYPFANWAGENIICSRRTPEAALRWWMSSAPHRRNILHAHFTHIGIGMDPRGQYGPDWVLNFAAGATETLTPELLAPGEGAAEPPGAY